MKTKTLAVSALMASLLMVPSFAGLTLDNISIDHSVTATVDMDNKSFAITGGCNTVIGGMDINQYDTFIAERNLASTLMACSEPLELMSLRIQSFLNNQPKVVREGNQLFLVGTIEGETRSVYMPLTLDQGSFKDVKAEAYERIFIYVSNEKVPCPNDPNAKCLQIRENKESAWQPYEGTIEGFSAEPGIAYRLRLKAYNKGTKEERWVYDMAVEQEVVE
ncbi:Hypothetical protein F387_01566 [Wohlfahrtiimonas chitiniclastica SH04]|uniref:DUF306 domain-containing protein n=1 Tax=Wohlfahrtiimonas chitiniclastica SH04 TaxID=1261130 RepID=L8XXB7_9GAMM|nr:DUF4377 domain-containing protein [Wohlfahrtiimonas chitiniclastica]ELV07449.1 Hypothetical protein F387_01566 [Wohlfahrtiimonas chitiniclastica SH04]